MTSLMTSLLYKTIKRLKPRPSPFPLIRVGPFSDGGYLLPNDLSGISACFSPGNDNRKPFEDSLLHGWGIQSYLLDKSSDVDQFATPLLSGQSFRKLWLSAFPAEDSITLSQWLAEADVPNDQDLILQMDIEGAEWLILSSVPSSILSRFRIIVVEFHGLGDLLNSTKLASLHAPALLNLTSNHTCVHVHPNNTGSELMIPGTAINIPTILECTFLRNDRFDVRFNSFIPSPPILPHPLDRCCSSNYPSLSLSAGWSANTMKFSCYAVFFAALMHRWRLMRRRMVKK